MASKSTKDVFSFVICRQAVHLCGWQGVDSFSYISCLVCVHPRKRILYVGGIGLVGIMGQLAQ